MSIIRKNSLSPISLEGWSWEIIFNEFLKQLSVFEIKPYPVPEEFLYKESFTKYQKLSMEVSLSTWACSFNKIKQARIACINGGKSFSVFNLVIYPFNNFDLPFFGADFVTLPNGHLLALDLQPALKSNKIHTKYVSSKLMPIYKRWQALLPSGGDIPREAMPFFSSGFLWTRLPLNEKSDLIIDNIIKPAFKEYMSLYIDLINNSLPVSSDRAAKLLEGQKLYLNYRSTKDPARGMLSRIFGKEWTEQYISEVLFKV